MAQRLPLFYRLAIPPTTGETKRVVSNSKTEFTTLKQSHGRQIVVCPRFADVNKEHRTIQGIPVYACVLCNVCVDNTDSSIRLTATQPVDVLQVFDDVDAVDDMIVDALVQCWRSEGEDQRS